MDFFEPRDSLDDIGKINPNEISEIQGFYANKTIFLTGASGFLGALTLEKLLRSCKDLRKIYVLFRSSKRLKLEDRLVEYFNDPLFDKMKQENPQYYKQVTCLQGDLTLDSLGLSPDDRQAVINNTQIIFHIAATVKFDEQLTDAYSINVKGTKSLIQLATQMKQLQSFVYVSTAYSNCDRKHTEEKYYDPLFSDEETITLIQHSEPDEQAILTPLILGNKPNTYIFTKSICEDLIHRSSGHLPVTVVRPSIIMPTLEEPMPYWTRSKNSLLMLLAGNGLGIVSVFYYSKHVKADFTPGDLTVNCILAAGWQKALVPESPEVYNCVGYESCISAQDVVVETSRCFNESKEAVSKLVWKNHIVQTDNTYILFFLYYFLHILPGIFFSLGERYMNRKPMIMKIYRQFFYFNATICYFTSQEFSFSNENTKALLNRLNARDRQLFGFDMASVDWMKFLSVLYRCVARYVMLEYPSYPKEIYNQKMRFIEPIDKAIIWSFRAGVVYIILSIASALL